MNFRGFFVPAALLACAPALLALEPTPPGPEVALGPNRAEIVLDGLWRFQPAKRADATAPDAGDWGLIRVPGAWAPQRAHIPGVVEKGAGDLWKTPPDELAAAWYERAFEVPATWAGRQITVEFDRISTDAEAWVNGRPAGKIAWPGGTLDLTRLVEPGKPAELRLRVTATAEDVEFSFMGIGQNTAKKATLAQRGILGDVFLRSRPAGPRVDGLFIQTSTRKDTLGVDVELTGVPAGASVEVAARAIPTDGGPPVAFPAVTTATSPLAGEPVLTVARVSWPWADARRWDYRQPNLYMLELTVTGPGLADQLRERFGFREWWIDGRRVFLNGIEFRPRIANIGSGDGVRPATEAEVARCLDRGIGLAWQWPDNFLQRGRPDWEGQLATAADEQGLPLLGNLVRLNEYMRDAQFQNIWEKTRPAWEKAVTREWRRQRNHPSFMGWILSGNVGPRHQDQNPRRIGQSGWAPDPALQGLSDARAYMRRLDPARTVLFGASAYEGDYYSAMTYLNFTPLQERREWLEPWITSGKMPYLAIEMGTPLASSFMRGRKGFGPTGETEPWVTEFAATYFGPRAYALESADYRRHIRSKYEGGEKFASFNFDPALQNDPAFQATQDLFIRETWHAWRAANAGLVSMLAWDMEQFMPINRGAPPVPIAANFQPGKTGAFPAEVPARAAARSWRGDAFTLRHSGETLLAAEAPTMAWIAGGPVNPADQRRHYRTGDNVQKQIILVNDTRTPQPFSLTWRTEGAGQGAKGEAAGQLAPAESKALPLTFPVTASDRPETGRILLDARIGTATHTDRREFQVFPAMPPLTGRVALWDPVGKTTALLKQLGVTTVPWNGKPTAMLVVGRETLSSGAKPPAHLGDYVAGGGRLLIMTQNPEWIRHNLGLRVSRHGSRLAWPTTPNHPVMTGLTAANLQDWAGNSTLIEARPEYAPDRFPEYGWRWGLRHMLATAAIEKPHLSGWRPILESEFDLQYSPLLELDFGRGRVTLCTLDLEDQGPADPAAERLARNLLGYVATAPLAPRAAKTIYLGGDAGAEFLEDTGLAFTRASGFDPGTDLAVIAPDAKVSTNGLNAFIQRGGRALVLAAPGETSDHFGATVTKKSDFAGSLTPPTFPEGRGLTASDLRFKADADASVLTGGVEIHSDGLLGVRRAGQGVAVFCQLDPAALGADSKEYFRFTRWRQTRAICQLLANLGASFEADARIFQPHAARIPLAGPWKVRFTRELPVVSWEQKHVDPGISDLAKSLVGPKADETGFTSFDLPGWHPRFEEISGEAVWRREIVLPEDWAGEIVTIQIPAIKSYDTVFWNGQPVGSTSTKTQTEDPWNLPRKYRLPPGIVKAGANTLAIRQFAPDKQGGIHGRKEEFYLRVLSSKPTGPGSYCPDYRESFETGDEPYRYYRW